tara:strand:+ start:307 stop:1035 length:729 start_codon:yes stop_codon:yes gene_type:complete
MPVKYQKLKSSENSKTNSLFVRKLLVVKRIKNEFCQKTKDSLSDESLMNTYIDTPSFKKKKEDLDSILKNILKKDKFKLDKKISDQIRKEIIQSYLTKLVPPGTKGVVRGVEFNKIIQRYLISLNLDEKRFELCFEKKCKDFITDEKPDWYLRDKKTKKVIVGMNQIDLWNGGQQINRASKYINKGNKSDKKLLCVICDKPDINHKTRDNKVLKLFEKGFSNDTICYLKSLEKVIKKYFNLK